MNFNNLANNYPHIETYSLCLLSAGKSVLIENYNNSIKYVNFNSGDPWREFISVIRLSWGIERTLKMIITMTIIM